MSLLRTLRTVRHLKAVQITDRLRRGARRSRLRGLPDAGSCSLRLRTPQPPALVRADTVDGARLRFLRVSREAGGDDRWDPRGVSRLWTYNLHYFQYLPVLDPSVGLALVEDWIARNPLPRGPGWEPYTISLRVREWIEWLMVHAGSLGARALPIVASVADQAQALSEQLEYHLLGNHLLENGIALAWAGISLKGPRAEGWAREGARLLRQELAVQVLADGTHDERSPMYQSMLAEGLLRLAAAAASVNAPEAADLALLCGEAGRRLARSLQSLTHPDGDIALLNDAALGQAPTVSQLARRFALPAPGPDDVAGSWALPQAGYRGARWTGGYLCFDVGPLGPDHQPGHGHADVLSFELSHRGERLVTDTGVFTYEPGAIRAADRGTAAHNTLEVDGRDQAELWGAFRCGRRPKIVSASSTALASATALEGAFQASGFGLFRLRQGRRLTVERSLLHVEDALTLRGRHVAVSRLHLAPGVSVRSDGGGLLLSRDGRALARVEGGEWEVGSSPYHPEFGLEVERSCLRLRTPFRGRLHARWQLRLL